MATVALLLLLAGPGDEAQADAPGLLEQETLLGDWGGARSDLAESGVSFAFTLTSEALSNVDGGLDRGTRIQALLDLVADADLGRAVGWEGAVARINPLWVEGEGLSDAHTGDLGRVSNIDALDGFRLFEAWIQQGAFDGRASLRAGLMAADQEFATAAPAALFLNGTFGMPVGISSSVPIPVYPLGGLGVRGRVEPSKRVHVQAAVFEGDPGTEEFNDTGTRVRLEDEEGLLAIAEAGVAALGGTWKAGAFTHSGDFVSYGSGDERRGNAGLYAVAEAKLGEGLDAFARVVGSSADRSPIGFYADAGISWAGPLSVRPKDVLGLAVFYARPSGEAPVDGDPEVGIELTCRIEAARWLFLQPDAQYIVHPGLTSAVDDAFVLGLRVEMIF